jgi:hypothetical protein
MVSRMYLLNKMTELDSEIHALVWLSVWCSSLFALCRVWIAHTRRRRRDEGQPGSAQASQRPGCEQGGRAPGAVGELPSRCRPRLSPFRPLLRLCVVWWCVYARGGVGCLASWNGVVELDKVSSRPGKMKATRGGLGMQQWQYYRPSDPCP